MKFQVGDLVEAFGVEGEVVAIDSSSWPIRVRFSNGEDELFSADGKLFDWHDEPSLVLIERKPKYVKKTLYAELFKDSVSFYLNSRVYEEKPKADALNNVYGYAPIEVFVREE